MANTPGSESAQLRSQPMTEAVQLEVGLLQNLNVLVWCVATKEAALVDPAYEVDRLLAEVAARGLVVKRVLLTHTHHDHTDGADEVVRATGAVVNVGAGEVEAARKAAPSAEVVGVVDGDALPLGEVSISCLGTPGHTVAGISYLVDGRILTGDTLFIGGCGRTDFPGGNPQIMWASLQRLARLPEETRVYPGHDYGQTPTSTIGWEVTTNPYLLCKTEADFVALRTGKTPHRPIRGPR